MNKIPDSLYIHIPFCDNICDYCDFTKLLYADFFVSKYLNSLKKEISLKCKRKKNFKTIYIGGGTPTSLKDVDFENLLKFLLPFTRKIQEYTVEANPESLTTSKLKIMRKYGVNRLSIGVESTDDKILKSINRKHTFNQVQEAISNAKRIGFNNINVDLIIGLPNCSKAHFKKDLENVLSLGVQHISCYSLTVNEHTVFYNKHIVEPNQDFSREVYDYIEKVLKAHKFIHYEVSNWALPKMESKHNFTYWKNKNYIGVGLGASGYINNKRYTNTKNIQKYIDNKFDDYIEIVSKKDEAEYEIMLNLRTIKGINLKEFQNKYHIDLLKGKENQIKNLLENNLIKFNKNMTRMHATHEGMMILDQIILNFID